MKLSILNDGERNDNPKDPNAGDLKYHNGFHAEIQARLISNVKELRSVAWQIRVASSEKSHSWLLSWPVGVRRAAIFRDAFALFVSGV